MSCPTSASNIPMEDLRCSFCQQANCDVRIASCGCFLHTVRGSEFPSCCKTRKRRNIQSNKQASDNTESTASLRIANPAYRYTLASVYSCIGCYCMGSTPHYKRPPCRSSIFYSAVPEVEREGRGRVSFLCPLR